jgi:hypothetical protein
MSSKGDKQVRWSISNVNMLRRCQRQYYFANIMAHHSFSNPLRRRAYELKQMKNLKMWRGSIVEKAIERRVINHLNEGLPVYRKEVISEAFKLAERQLEFSAKQLYKDKSLTKNQVGDDYCILDKHKLDSPFEQGELEGIYADIEKSINNFFDTCFADGTYILDFISAANWRKPNLMSIKFEFEKISVTPQIDLLLYKDNKPVVIDWKVSNAESSDYARQLFVCGIAIKDQNARKGRKFNFNDIELYEINLLKSTVKQHHLNREKVNETIDYIYQTAGDIDLLVKGINFDEVAIEEFELTENEGSCAMCNFQPLCEDILTKNVKDHETPKQLQLF